MSQSLLIILAYLTGSIPTSVWVSKYFFGIDIRDYGSGNAGATNTYRVLGSKWGTIVMVADVLKGVLATSFYLLIPDDQIDGLERINFMIGLGLSAIIGHIFPIFADFKGGKGVATLFGMGIAIQPIVAFSCVAVFLLVLFLTRFVSLSSILASIAFAVFIILIWNEKELSYRIFAAAVALMVIVTHYKNIRRIIKGTESKISLLKPRDRKKAKKS